MSPAPPVEELRESPGTLSIDQVPDWIKMDPAEYVRRRDEEIASALWSAKTFDGDWIQYAASMLHTIGSMAPEFGSHHHACSIVSDALMKQSDHLSSLTVENERLREALKPFANAARDLACPAPDGHDDGLTVVAYIHARREREVTFSSADFGNARAALSSLPAMKGDEP